MNPKAVLIYHLKQYVGKKYILEQTIYAVHDLKRYPDGVKYSLIFIDVNTGDRVLMDNHHPKGHHVHLGKKQIEYIFKDETKLIEDFKKFVFQHMGKKL